MTKEKQTVGHIRNIVCVLAALAFGAYLGLPASAAEGSISVDKSLAAIQRMEETRTDAIHNKAESNSGTMEAVEAESKPKQETIEAVESEPRPETIELVVSEPKQETQPEYICTNANRGGAATRKETDTLIRLINAEAYGLSYEAKLAVGQVVMNRWVGPYYGDDLLAIMTAPHQFTPIYDGSAYKKEIEPDSIKAAYAVLEGTGVKGLTSDTYYFVNPDFTEDKTIERKMDFVCEIEGIHFFKPPAK